MSPKGICLLLIVSAIWAPFRLVLANVTPECGTCVESFGGEADCLPFKCPDISASFDKFAGSQGGKDVIGLLSRVENAEDYPDTIIENENVMQAMSLFIRLPGIGELPKEEREWLFRYFTVKADWEKEMSFGVAMNRVNGDLYLVDFHTAATTQPSSLYVFDGSTYTKIARGENGMIGVTDFKAKGNELGVIYYRENSSHPEKDFALLEKEKNEWFVRWNSFQESEWISADGDVEYLADDLSLLAVTGSCFGLGRVEETARNKIFAVIGRQDAGICFTSIWERKGGGYVRKSKLPAGSSLYERLREMVD
ncbi:MAG: hypothetical protein HY885_14940 [Deltaproteobacteria bacterium]|nr:hypothetical protein [Deltaproteobacteria bacterium]